MDFSNFLSTFNSLNNVDASDIDLMTTVSPSILLNYSDPNGGPYYGRYLCFGNLLIQFSSLENQDSSGALALSNDGIIYTLSFPTPYETIPYSVMPYILRLGYTSSPSTDTTWGAIATLSNITTSNFSFKLSDNAAGIGFISIGPRPSAFYSPPPFITTGSVQYIPGLTSYYVIIFYSSGSITFTSDIRSVSIICVGGGGGGGQGYQTFNGTIYIDNYGAGGGGGGNYQLGGQSLIAGTYNITVGNGGAGGSDSIPVAETGGTSSVMINNTPIIICTGGEGGNSYAPPSTSPAGTCTYPPNVQNTSGGSGKPSTGTNSDSYNDHFYMPQNLLYYINTSYSGGGAGGGSGTNSNRYGGGCGVNGKGGSTNGSSSYAGQDATTPGSGGGGAAVNPSKDTNGGDGANGIVIMYTSLT